MTSAMTNGIVSGHADTLKIPSPSSGSMSSRGPDNTELDKQYRPFLLPERQPSDWTEELELDTITRLVEQDRNAGGQPLKILVLYGSLRERSVIGQSR